MADSYSKWVMTTAFANNLQASINSGNKIEWVSIKTSNDTHLFADLAGFNDTTLATASIKQTATINAVSINGNTVTITALFNNQDNQADYYIKTLFLVAKYNGTEFLAGATVANSASTAFRMPAASATEITEFTARPQITVSNSSTISATVDPVAAATNKRVDGLETMLQGEIDDINIDKQSLWNTLVNYVTKAGTDTITGVKTFTQTIVGSVTGNAGTSTRLQTPRKLKVNLASTADQTFDGSSDQVGIGVNGVLGTNNGGTGRTDGLAKPLTTPIADNTDLNTLTTAGQYSRATNVGITNYPSGTNGSYFSLTVRLGGSGNGNNVFQEYADTNTGNIYQRTGSLPGAVLVWTSWKRVADDSTVVHNTGTENVDGDKTFIGRTRFSGELKGGQVNLPASGDLNTLTDTGKYYQTASINAANWTNRPSNAPSLAFSVDVIGQANQSLTTQVYYVHQNSRMWVRTMWLAGTTITTSPWVELANDSNVIHNSGNETVAGIKTFSSPITGSVTGNAGTATKLATARTIAVTGDVTGSGTFDGSGNLSIATTESATARTNTTSTQAGTDGATVTMIDGVTTNSAGEVTGINTKTLTLPPTQTTVTGNAGTATKLQTARTIGGVSFDGTANINLPGVNTAGNQSTSGNAGTATKLQTARTINGVSFDGSANISVNAANDASLVHKTGNETVAGVKTFSDWPVVTGLNVSNGTNTSGIVRINASIPNQSDNNVPIGLNTGSTLVLGGGEAANSYLAAMAAGAVPIGSASANNEQLVMAGDAAVYIGAGYQDGGTTGKWWAFNQDGTITSPNGNIMQEVTSTTINLYGKGTYFVNDTTTDGDHLRLIVSGKVVSVQGTLMTKVAMSGGAYLGEALIPAQYAPPVARKNTVGLNVSSPGSKVFADVAWSIDGMLSIDNIVNGSNMTSWGTIPAGSQLSFSDTWVIA